MIKKTNKRSSTMTIIVLAMHLIVSAIKLVAAGGQELIVRRATTVATVCLVVNITIRKGLTLSSACDIINI